MSEGVTNQGFEGPAGDAPSNSKSQNVTDGSNGTSANFEDNVGGVPISKLPPSPTFNNKLPNYYESNPEDTVKVVDNDTESATDEPERAMWGSELEFLMSCIATSVGLGNVWRFPFTAFQNGGGAFLIPYLIVLVLIGRPMYYLECIVGQFSSRNSVKIWSMSPAMKGTGYTQALGCSYILSYYVSIIAMCLYYLVFSFSAELPWAVCREEWGPLCVPSVPDDASRHTRDFALLDNGTDGPQLVSSAELYFTNVVLQLSDGIDDGIGTPIWYLALCLLVSWIIIFVIVAQGVKSSGKAAYFLALFPYVIMFILLIRSVTLTGAGTGILFFLTPQWEKLLELDVWYAAITQVFFSLSVSTGAIIMFSSYNGFRQNVYRDAMVVTTLDTLTSLMSGITIFGILGNLAYELDADDINSVIGSGGTGLAFISYPDAIAKSPFAPQLFAVLFFLMMAVLGVGSAVALLSTVNTLLLDSFPRVPTYIMSGICCIIGFLVGLVYVTPGGQYVLELVDHYGGTFLTLFGGISEIVGVFWIYGLENICLDIEYMLGRKTGLYFRICWSVIMPAMMFVVFIYAILSFEELTYGDDYYYPMEAHISGYVLLISGIVLVPLFMGITLIKYRNGNFVETVKKAFTPKLTWGPKVASDKKGWLTFRREAEEARLNLQHGRLKEIGLYLIGGYRKGV